MRPLRPSLLALTLAAPLLHGCGSAPPGEAAAPPAETSKTPPAPTERADPWVSLEVEDADLAEVMATLGQRVGRVIQVEPTVHEKVSIKLAEVHWREGVLMIAREARCVVDERADGALILSQPPVVTTTQGQPSATATLELIAASRRRSISLPPHFPEQAATGLDLRGMEWRAAIERLLGAAGDYEVWDYGAQVLRVMHGEEARRERKKDRQKR
ncbi:MAG: hypothetical protein AB7N76_08475 [Planctomycetota bacterium]